jgi:ribonuclease BN (tRNA processing enzyme)
VTDALRITVLGKSPAWQDAGGACSGYLVQGGATTIVLDCGNGVFGKLRRFVDYVDVDAVVLSHLHADHILDLVPYAYALTYAARQQPVPVHTWPGTADPARPALHGPPGTRDIMRRIVGAWGDEKLVEAAFDLREYDPADELQIGALHLRFRWVPHYLPTYAIEVTMGDARLTYGADCSPCEDLVEFARDTELLIIEGTLPRPERTGIRGHLTPGEAGQHGKDAGARRLVLTHVSDELGERWAREEAEATFGASVEVAREGAVYEVGGRTSGIGLQRRAAAADQL